MGVLSYEPVGGFYWLLLLKKTSQFKTVCKDDNGYVTQLKQHRPKR